MGIEMEKNAYETKKSERPIWDIDESEVSLKSVNKGVEIPADLTCPICKDLLKVCIISCTRKSIRDGLLFYKLFL